MAEGDQNKSAESVATEEEEEQESLPETQTCRLCNKEVAESELITTCLCPSPQSKVHQACMEDYIEVTGARLCPICKFPYSIRYVRRYSIREGILIYNQHDLKMIWIRLLALMLVVFTTVPLITYSLKRLLAISNQSQDELSNSLFTTTSMTFVFYTLLVVSIYVAVCTTIVMLLDPVVSWLHWWNSVTKIRFGPMSKFNF